ncbi:hypothetical protein [Sphingomicrobium marinum]|uniref:hypothetical protein n=1 Tax=Sphingomicrobium marinum TaxID=1227950 RepID=UPI0022400C03|nr:hypothetical protein [Sphingomicrobium marinum]
MSHWKFLAAAALITAPASAQPVEETETEIETVEEKVTVDENGERHVEKTVVRKKGVGGEGMETIERDRAEKMASDCPGRIFATKIEMTSDDGKKQSREIKLCGESDDPEKWVTLLESAKEKVIQMDALDAAGKASLLDDIDAEIARTQSEANDG